MKTHPAPFLAAIACLVFANSLQATVAGHTSSFLTSPTSTDEAQNWIEEVIQLKQQRCDTPARGSNPKIFPSYYEPKNLSEAEKGRFLLEGLMRQKSRKQKLACLKILVERFPITTRENIRSIAENGALDREIRRRAIWIAGMMRLPDSTPWLEKLLNNMEPVIRESAVDALGMTLFPHYIERFTSPNYLQPYGNSIVGPIPIYIDSMFRMSFVDSTKLDTMTNEAAAQLLSRTGISKNKPFKKLADEATRSRIAKRLQKIMTVGRTQPERIAAARALAGYQPQDYKLRVAEWGVWIHAEGKLQLVKSVLEEIPPFAYQTTQQVAELKKRVNQIMIVTKPVVHISVDQPMSLDVTAFIRQGQPWFSYPQPNDFALEVGGPNVQRSEITDNDFLDLRKTQKTISTQWKPFGKQAHQGYPFLLPKHSMIGGFGGRGLGRGRGFDSMNLIQAIGVRWQHLIVSPRRESWMIEEAVAPEFKWWSELRQVNSAWVSNGFESEKFIYYDGPTKLPSPLHLSKTWQGKHAEYVGVYSALNQSVSSASQLQQPLGLLVRVANGKLTGKRILFESTEISAAKLAPLKKKLAAELTGLRTTTPLSKEFDLDQASVLKEFVALLKIKNGLNADEAQGLFQSWKKQFFETEGTRLIVRIRREDYDFQCPLKVTPPPTQLARVGLILTELE